MTHTETLLLEMLKATTLALRVALGHVEAPYAQTARAIHTDAIRDDGYRQLNGAQRAAIADAGTAIMDAVAVAKGLKSR